MMALGATRYSPGATVNDRYEILATLGQGGMGEAYKARDRKSGQIVVIKVPYASSIGDPATYSRYERELDIGKRLDHPGIQRLLQSGRLDKGVAPYVVFEYIEGQPMREYLRSHAPLEPATAIDFAAQLADVLEYVHGHGVVHRDLKPENVLITPDGKAKLVDFGIALLQGARRLTFQRLSSEVGTPDYMAPEQVQGERGDARTDVYALGVMLFEMVTGQAPYRGDSPLAIMSQHVTTDAPLLSARRRDIPPALEAIVYRALQRNPADRYSSMAAFKYDLQHLDEVEIPGYSVTRPRRGVLSAHAVPVFWIVLAVACLVLIGVIAEFIHRAQVPH